MDYFFNPQGIALVGATSQPVQGGGNAILKNLIKSATESIYPINPRYQ